MKICPNCQLEMEDKYKFCYQCGGKLQEKIEIAFCPCCGEKVETDGEFCPFCGNALNDNSNVEPVVVKSEDKAKILNKDFNSEVKKPLKPIQKNDKYETTVFGWIAIVLVYLFDLIAGLVVYHIARMVRRKAVFDSLGLKYTGNEFSVGELILAVFIVYSLFFASVYFVRKISAKAAKYLLNIVIVGIVTIPLIGCIFGFIVSSVLFCIYLAYAIISCKDRKVGKSISDYKEWKIIIGSFVILALMGFLALSKNSAIFNFFR